MFHVLFKIRDKSSNISAFFFLSPSYSVFPYFKLRIPSFFFSLSPVCFVTLAKVERILTPNKPVRTGI